MEPKPSGGVMKYLVGIVIIAVVIIGVSILSSKDSGNNYQSASKTPTEDNTSNAKIAQTDESLTISTTSSKTETFTIADVATHNDSNSCYTIIENAVYDVTPWIYKHPGGPDKILSLCGKDGTSAFEKKHAGQPKPEEQLATFKIGELAK